MKTEAEIRQAMAELKQQFIMKRVNVHQYNAKMMRLNDELYNVIVNNQELLR